MEIELTSLEKKKLKQLSERSTYYKEALHKIEALERNQNVTAKQLKWIKSLLLSLRTPTKK